MRTFCVLITIIVLLFGCVKPSSKSNATTRNDLLFAYSMLAPSNTGTILVYGRVIVQGDLASSQLCPEIVSEHGKVLATVLRGLKPAANLFPVTVCEVILEPETRYQVKGSNLQLSKASLDPSNVQIFGDTGCKTKVCKQQAAEPFKTLADIAAQNNTDLLLHMGDYNYRGTSGSINNGDIYAYDAGDGGYGGKSCGLEDTYYSQNAKNSPKPDTWSSWELDFFKPAKKLMSSAPWVFARGNHELCSRAGIGWFYFFGPGGQFKQSVNQQSCPFQGDFNTPPKTAANHIAMIKPYALPLKRLNIWVYDSANACDELASNQLTAQYTEQFEHLNAFASNSANPTWVMTHRPIWGVNSVSPLDTLNKQLQVALTNTKAGMLPLKVALSLSGHMHIYQSITPQQNSHRPPQIVVGNSGVSLSSKQSNQSVSVKVDEQMSITNTQGKFGYLAIDIKANASDWAGEFIGVDGQSFIACDASHVVLDKPICDKIE
ncbi:hypothetical protein PSECIP111951_01867 [Pseudoalteromonas holothuriae]|uniref:Calcineurin-like phosphoesterase domain-containing protein n=1 Tax=Pseudoalteromonas holothuriae TaxID=2963714 RepID=A0A9W4QYC3_9GAMM|nr:MULTISPECIES: metallophosphoesterase [unclassified Pseudoalteromonas]CAH9058273.1 hypothetical protein PSECIP111854_02169 [Pseudoalteromonas sp. CIP111854]CAH9058395.1 hypothetical protein PSECIP111951_01867 [Pseudoalteromonas sp. CIP111951]